MGVKQETSAIDEDGKNGAVETQIKVETDVCDVKTSTEIKSEDQEVPNEVKSMFDEKIKDIVNEDLESSNNIKSENSVESDDSKSNDSLETNKDGFTVQNDNDIVENKNENLPTAVNENKILPLNTSEDTKHLEDFAENNAQLENSKIEKHLQVNGEIKPINHDQNSNEHNSHLISNDDEIESKKTQIQNSLNTLFSENAKVNVSEEKNDDIIPMVINEELSDDVNKKLNGTIVNQDSISNSSDSETIMNSESLQHEINGVNIENNEENVVAQPISVITIQTCDTIDSDCSEAYLTPNELNDTPKKIVDNTNLSTNDYVSTVKDDASQFNPSLESSENEILPKSSLEPIIVEQEINDKSVNEDEIKIDKADGVNNKENQNSNKAELNIDESIKNLETNDTEVEKENELIENCTEAQVESKNDSDIINQLNEDPNQNKDRDGMFYSWFTYLIIY